MLKLSILLCLVYFSALSYGLYGIRTVYPSAGCTGTPVLYTSYLTNTCVPLGNPVSYVLITYNATFSTTTFFNDSACSVPGTSAPSYSALNNCTSNGGYYVALAVSSSLPTASSLSNAYNSSSFLSSTCAGAPYFNELWNPSQCFISGSVSVNYLCNATYTTVRTYTSAGCTGNYTDVSQLTSAGCQSNITNTCANVASSSTTSGLTSSTTASTSNHTTSTSSTSSASSTSTSTTSAHGTSTSTSTSSAPNFITPAAWMIALTIAFVFFV